MHILLHSMFQNASLWRIQFSLICISIFITANVIIKKKVPYFYFIVLNKYKSFLISALVGRRQNLHNLFS